ncbi:type III polyketide synthase [Singulisphaera sp. PoT]|uniref:type III polyketide synthase n=1 Tax=Singulisphaera sp. PoT TaxID=3411797 RepID=UPI003BF526BE
MPTWIAGIGTALPQHRIAQADAAEIAQQFSCETPAQERLFQAMYRKAGVEGRHCVVLDASEGDLAGRQSFFNQGQDPTTFDRMRKYEAEAGHLAVSAAKVALDDAGIDPGRVTHLITVTCTGFYSPGFDISLIKQLPLSPEVARTQVGFMGCHGLLNALRVAKSFLDADPSACVLVSAVELCSLHHQYGWNPDKIVANSLFADGSAALVAVASPSGLNERSPAPYRVVGTGSTLIEDSEDAMSWRIGNHGFEMTLSPRVPELIGRHLLPWLEPWLAKYGQSLATIGSWAIHPGGPRILSAVHEATGLDRSALEVSQRVLAECGNMSSPTILFILDRLYRARAPRPCVALAFGPGLMVEAAFLE